LFWKGISFLCKVNDLFYFGHHGNILIIIWYKPKLKKLEVLFKSFEPKTKVTKYNWFPILIEFVIGMVTIK